MKTLHFDCFAGISGDMALGAFVDLGVDPQILKAELKKLNVYGWALNFVREARNGIMGTRALVEIEDEHEHSHDHGHHHEHSHHSWKEIRHLIETSDITENAKKRSLDIFIRIAKAEAVVHGKSVDEVTFHEVGALDSIIDIVGAAICLDLLAPQRITAGEIELGGGTVTCAHGVLPVPAPATLLLVQGLPVKTGGFDKEMTTPTGAAILASCVDEFITEAASFTEIKTGVGIGVRIMEKPNILRVSWRETGVTPNGNPSDAGEPWIVEDRLLLEASVDDMTGEEMGFFMEQLFKTGALDVTFTPCTMKKGRPGTILSVLSHPCDSLDSIREAFFRYSTTAGFKEIPVRCISLKREERNLPGMAREKILYLKGDILRSKIEYEDRAALAREQNISLKEAENKIQEKR
jgi:uncharacterized protein (TIGR00299 family) protein